MTGKALDALDRFRRAFFDEVPGEYSAFAD
jgi:hypothetical protein